MESIYILKLTTNKYYVGKSFDVPSRYKQHVEGRGSTWTKKYPPIKLVETRPLSSPHDETNTTKDLMKKYGVDNVRGGAYCMVELSDETKKILEHELRASTDSCYKCGKKGHFARYCDEQKEEVWGCEYCDRTFTTRFGCMVHEKSCKQTVDTCYRCGREGHYSAQCYAKSHVDGYRL